MVPDLSSLKNDEKLISLLKNNSGVYLLYNKVNGKCFIASAWVLKRKILDYTQPNYLKSGAHIIIARALLKYGLESFTLYILSSVDKKNSNKDSLLKLEQQYIDLISPKYNMPRRKK